MKPFKATKKPVTIEAIQLTKESVSECVNFVNDERTLMKAEPAGGMLIKTLEGSHLASYGDYIIKGVKGEFYPCKPDIFLETYDIHNESETQTMVEVSEEIGKSAEVGMILCQDENGDFHLYKPVKAIPNKEGKSVDEVMDALSGNVVDN